MAEADLRVVVDAGPSDGGACVELRIVVSAPGEMAGHMTRVVLNVAAARAVEGNIEHALRRFADEALARLIGRMLCNRFLESAINDLKIAVERADRMLEQNRGHSGCCGSS